MEKSNTAKFPLKDLPEGKVSFNINLQLENLPTGEEGQKRLKDSLLMIAQEMDEIRRRLNYLDVNKKDRKYIY